jgi:hypothetical protein
LKWYVFQKCSAGALVARQLDIAERVDFTMRRGDWVPAVSALTKATKGTKGTEATEATGATEGGKEPSTQEDGTALHLQQMGKLLQYLCDPLTPPPPPLVKEGALPLVRGPVCSSSTSAKYTWTG